MYLNRLISHRTEQRCSHTLFYSHTLLLLVKSTPKSRHVSAGKGVNMTSEGKEKVRMVWVSVINPVTLVNA